MPRGTEVIEFAQAMRDIRTKYQVTKIEIDHGDIVSDGKLVCGFIVRCWMPDKECSKAISVANESLSMALDQACAILQRIGQYRK